MQCALLLLTSSRSHVITRVCTGTLRCSNLRPFSPLVKFMLWHLCTSTYWAECKLCEEVCVSKYQPCRSPRRPARYQHQVQLRHLQLTTTAAAAAHQACGHAAMQERRLQKVAELQCRGCITGHVLRDAQTSWHDQRPCQEM